VNELTGDRRVWKFQLDTYEREVERYGGPLGMVLSEKLFWVDSQAVLEIVETLSGDEGADARWRPSLRALDMLLDDLGFDDEKKRSVIKTCRASFSREYRADVNTDRQLGDKYRKGRIDMEAILAAGVDDQSWLAPGYATLRKRSEAMKPIAA